MDKLRSVLLLVSRLETNDTKIDTDQRLRHRTRILAGETPYVALLRITT